jgi:hypothetical protein
MICTIFYTCSLLKLIKCFKRESFIKSSTKTGISRDSKQYWWKFLNNLELTRLLLHNVWINILANLLNSKTYKQSLVLRPLDLSFVKQKLLKKMIFRTLSKLTRQLSSSWKKIFKDIAIKRLVLNVSKFYIHGPMTYPQLIWNILLTQTLKDKFAKYLLHLLMPKSFG